MRIPIQIELQSIDIKDCDLERDLSTVLLSISDSHFFFFLHLKKTLSSNWPDYFHSCIHF